MDGAKHIERKPALPDEVARLLRHDIVHGTWQAGAKLPSEQTLCQTYGVSRPVIREAISRLKYDGLVDSHQGRGVFVSKDGVGRSFRIDVENLDDQQELQHILELMVAVEVGATGVAASRRSAEDLDDIRACLEGMTAAIEDQRSGVDEDLGFHTAIVRATGNPFFIELSSFLEARARKFIRTARTNTARFEGLAHEVQNEHQAIFDALVAGDEAEARSAAERHLRNAARRLRIYAEDS